MLIEEKVAAIKIIKLWKFNRYLALGAIAGSFAIVFGSYMGKLEAGFACVAVCIGAGISAAWATKEIRRLEEKYFGLKTEVVKSE